MRCIHAERTEAEAQPASYSGDWGWRPTELWLCTWGVYDERSAETMAQMPSWLVKMALAGQPVTEEICARCSCMRVRED